MISAQHGYFLGLILPTPIAPVLVITRLAFTRFGCSRIDSSRVGRLGPNAHRRLGDEVLSVVRRRRHVDLPYARISPLAPSLIPPICLFPFVQIV